MRICIVVKTVDGIFQGKPNDCIIPNTEKVADREGPNFCDAFEI
jgi:hypothetical protein